MRQWGSEAARHGAGRSAVAGGDASSASILRVMAPPCSSYDVNEIHAAWAPAATPHSPLSCW